MIPDPNVARLAAEDAAFVGARPVFDRYCADCHASSGENATDRKLARFDLDRDPSGDAVRRVLGLGDAAATMPYDKPGVVRGDDLALIAIWVDAWQAAHVTSDR